MSGDKDFAVGDIVTISEGYAIPESGEVTEVEEDGGYVSVRIDSGMVFAFRPSELEATGRKLDPQALSLVKFLDSAIRNAQNSVYSMEAMRNILSNMTVDRQ